MSDVNLPPILEDYLRQIESVKAEAQALTAQYSAEQLQRRPAPERWSAIENLDHLRATVLQYLPAIDAAMAAASPLAAPDPAEPRYGFVWRLFLKTLEPPARRRFRAPAVFLPRERPPISETLAGFLAAHDAVIERLYRAAFYDLRRVKVTSPGTPLLKPPLGCVLAMMSTHARRHLWHARQALAAHS